MSFGFWIRDSLGLVHGTTNVTLTMWDAGCLSGALGQLGTWTRGRGKVPITKVNKEREGAPCLLMPLWSGCRWGMCGVVRSYEP